MEHVDERVRRASRVTAVGQTVPTTLAHAGLFFLAIHLPLAVAMRAEPAVAAAHAGVAVAFGLAAVLVGRVDWLVYGAAYLAGADVLWRMVEAPLPWEAGKYAVIMLFVVGLVRVRPLRIEPYAVLYLLILLPAILVMPYRLAWDTGLEEVRFNLSGPVALAVSVLFLSNVRLGGAEWVRTVLCLLGPLLSVLTLAALSTLGADDLAFTLESNVVTSGGFGPNQVSAVLGLGGLVAFLVLVAPFATLAVRVVMLAALAALVVQCALTLSRGGLLAAIGAATVAAAFLLRDRRSLALLFTSSVVIGTAAAFWVLPRLNAFTEGAVSGRFSSLETTGRYELLQQEIATFRDHPLTGVGPGGGKALRASGQPAHTEFSRLLAEHGVFGIGAALLLVALGFRLVRRGTTPYERAVAAGLVCWSFLTMMHSAMRVVAPALVFGLAAVRLQAARVAYRPAQDPGRTPVGTP